MSVTDSHPSYASLGRPGEVGPRHFANGRGHVLDDRNHNERPDPLRPEPRQDELWAAELQARRVRAKVASRLELVNLNHAEHAWRLRNSFGIASTCLALIYLEPGPIWEVRIAGKAFPDTEQVADAGRLLYDVCGLAREVMAAGQDPRVEMSENAEPMSPLATLYGVALSTLDTPAGSWTEVKARTAGGCLHIPGRVLALLVDDTMLLADRIERHHPVHYFVSATSWLDAAWVGMGRTWRHSPELATLGDPATRDLWLRLVELRAILTGANLDH